MKNHRLNRMSFSYFNVIITLMIILILYLTPQNTFAQTNGEQKNVFVSVDPLGFLTFGPSINAEVALGNYIGLQTGFRILNWGLFTDKILNETEDFYPDMKLSWTVNFEVKFYIKPKNKLNGFYLGPQFDYGRSIYESDFVPYNATSPDKQSINLMVFGIGVGYKWIWESGFSLEPSYTMAAFLWKSRGQEWGVPAWDLNLFALYILSIKVGIAF